MENKDNPAFPFTYDSDCNVSAGLTKREYFAAMAMNGYISAGSNGMPDKENIAKYAIEAADELLKQLDS